MIDILKEIREKLEQIEICIDILKDRILEKDEEMDQLKEELYIKENATWQETPE